MASDPNKPGSQTTEGKYTVIIGIVGAIIAGLSTTVAMLKEVLPDNQMIVLAASVIGGFATLLGIGMSFNKGRSNVKVAQLGVKAAEELAKRPQ